LSHELGHARFGENNKVLNNMAHLFATGKVRPADFGGYVASFTKTFDVNDFNALKADSPTWKMFGEAWAETYATGRKGNMTGVKKEIKELIRRNPDAF
jgi:hypothetical protein